ncbi:right-handed parallel beta-helix repeat-containing protein [Bacteroides sp.]|uniref:right-handed parallel beta-helix repeat-containing protein n=1 Tax=Bacteroides sp. TaxID=29523 RepID=UPI0040295C53
MKIKEFYILLVAFLLLSCAENGIDAYTYQPPKKILNENPASYYLDATSGDDANDGTSPENAWKTLDKASGIKLKPGDALFFKKGEVFNGVLEISAEGTKEQPIVIDSYGEGDSKPSIQGNINSIYAVRIYNSTYVTIQNIEIVNQGTELAGRSGLKVECVDYGISRGMILRNLTVRDVTSTFYKPDYGGAILFINKGNVKKSRYENLLIEGCHIKDCQRNGIFWGGSGGTYCNRKNWYPSKNVIIRNNLIEGVPGDGILPIGCDGVLIEYNVMRDGKFLPNKGAAAGIWPWSCDNVVIQFNDVSGHQADADGQAYDSDFNCTNTIIQYNYSHDNYGGFVLICDDPTATYVNSIGIIDTEIRYNISINDGINPRAGVNPTSIQFFGCPEEALLEYNIIHASPTPDHGKSHSMIRISGGEKAAINPTFRKNIFYAPIESSFSLGSKPTIFENNWFLGSFKNKPEDMGASNSSDYYQKNVVDVDPKGYQALYKLMEKRMVGGKEHYFVKKEAIEAFFAEMEKK